MDSERINQEATRLLRTVEPLIDNSPKLRYDMLWRALSYAMEIIDGTTKIKGADKKRIVMRMITLFVENYDEVTDHVFLLINSLEPMIDYVVEFANHHKKNRSCCKFFCR